MIHSQIRFFWYMGGYVWYMVTFGTPATHIHSLNMHECAYPGGGIYVGLHGTDAKASLSLNSTAGAEMRMRVTVVTPFLFTIFAVVMAMCSAVHSYLIVAYSGKNKVAKVRSGRRRMSEWVSE